MEILNDLFGGDLFAGLGDLSRVLLAMLFVAVAALISRWQRADLEKDLFWATVRSFVQLIAIGYLLELIFQQDNPVWTLLLLGVMVLIAARTTGRRGENTPRATLIALVSIGFGTALTIGVLVLLDVFAFTPQAIIPIGGMIVGNAMTTATLVIVRLSDDLAAQRNEVETKLALGATGRQASLTQFRRALQSAMVPIIDTTKTVGLIKLPGAMTGMILAGASPIEAVQLQLIVMYMLVGANTFTGLSAAFLTYRAFFSPAQQLRVVGQP
ncbi:MAG: iron export ABC transporter permease subunit FetB [Anaerolineae bacterium]|nr:iron export ABC transporter permease subunit FetB [Anaerolineae bacterium]